MIHIRQSTPDELSTILEVELDAFSNDSEIHTLVSDLFADPDAAPLISLLAFDNKNPVGHIYLSVANLEPTHADVRIMLLAPLAVVKSRQREGIGTFLIHSALEKARSSRVDLVFVLGHPAYYPRCGFSPAGQFGFEAPYPIEEKNAAAWMVLELSEGAIQKAGGGKVQCAQSLMKPEYWRE